MSASSKLTPSAGADPVAPVKRRRFAAARLWQAGRHELIQLYRSDQKLKPLLLAVAVVGFVGALWDLPTAYGWENDGAAPRDLFGGIANNLTLGKGHRYPVFHYLLLGCLASPVLLVDVAVALLGGTSIEAAVVSVPSMTAIALISKLLNLAMLMVAILALARALRSCWSVSAGRWAALFAAVNLSVAYYGRATNMDGPYLMWTALAIDRLLMLRDSGKLADYGWFAFFVAAGLATKDQAYASFVLVGPVYLVALPLLRREALAAGASHFRHFAKALGVGALSYLTLSGTLVNPTGLVARVKALTGTNSQDWKTYESTLGGYWDNTRFILEHQNDYWWPWPIVGVAWLGVLIAIFSTAPETRRERHSRVWQLLPLLAGLSSFLTFTLVVGRDAHRFVLPLGFFLAGYAGVAISTVLELARSPLSRRATLGAALLLVALGFSHTLELLVTQWTDARRDVEQYLAELPKGSTVETYGLGVYLPRFALGSDSNYSVTHVRAERKRRAPVFNGMQSRVDDYQNVVARAPDVLVIPEAFAERYLPKQMDGHRIERQAVATFKEQAGAVEFFKAAHADQLSGYARVDIGAPSPPAWYRALGGRIVRVHGSTGQNVWVLRRVIAASAAKPWRLSGALPDYLTATPKVLRNPANSRDTL